MIVTITKLPSVLGEIFIQVRGHDDIMRQAVLAFRDETIAEWGFAPFQDAGLLDAEMLSCEGARGVARIHVDDEIDEARLGEMEVVQWWERIPGDESETVYLVEFDGSAAQDGQVIDGVDLPPSQDMEVTDRGFEMTYIGPQTRIRDVVAEFESAGHDVTLRQLGGYRIEDEPLDALTDRQLEVLQTAHGKGYYDIPRNA